MTPEVAETWNVIDRWWTEEPITKEYAEVLWGERKVVMLREGDDEVWRVWKGQVAA